MRVAIAEDDANYALHLQSLLQRFQEETGVTVESAVFSDGAELAAHYTSDWDVLLLDVDMPNLDGLATARWVRQRDPEVLILFITNLAQYAICGYEVDALDYMLKPVNYYALEMKLKKALRLQRLREPQPLLLNREGELVRVPLSHLYYVEVFNHQLCYHTMEGDLTATGARSLRALEQELAPKGFSRCNHCYLVNLRHVDGIQGNYVRVAGQELSISRNRRKGFLQDLLHYARGGEPV